MKKQLLVFQFLVAVLTQLNAQKIYEFFTGSATGGTYSARFVILSGFAPNASVVGKSIQHRGSTSTFWVKIDLTGNADAQGPYRIWFSGSSAGAPWTPELVTTVFTLTNTGNAQVALMNNTTLITDNTCPSGGGLLDLVGYSGTASPGESVCRETSSAPAATSLTVKRRRKGALPGQDTGNNSTDIEIVPASATLPIELVSFDVQNTEGAKNHLTWTTASEKDNSHFDIERSTDGNSFHSIGQVKGKNKASSYQYTDAAPFTTSYYRLKQVDYDGTATYSKVVSVTNKGGKALKVYPTLVSNGILTVDTEGGDYAIYNIVGQQVQSGQTTQRLDVSALVKGTYILKVGTEQAKFVKQ